MMMMILQYRLLAFQSRIAHKLHYSFSVSKLEMLFFLSKSFNGQQLQGTPFQNFTWCCILLIWKFANGTWRLNSIRPRHLSPVYPLEVQRKWLPQMKTHTCPSNLQVCHHCKLWPLLVSSWCHLAQHASFFHSPAPQLLGFWDLEQCSLKAQTSFIRFRSARKSLLFIQTVPHAYVSLDSKDCIRSTEHKKSSKKKCL